MINECPHFANDDTEAQKSYRPRPPYRECASSHLHTQPQLGRDPQKPWPQGAWLGLELVRGLPGQSPLIARLSLLAQALPTDSGIWVDLASQPPP